MPNKIKNIIKAGLLTVGLSFSGYISKTTAAEDSLPDSINTIDNITNTQLTKRVAQKIYSNFNDIPEISDAEAVLYARNEYTYIINGKHYMENGEIELKRVLADEVTSIGPMCLVYRSECPSYTPKENEDPLKNYIDDDFTILSRYGTYVGPSQMNNDAASNYIKYLAVNPETCAFVEPFLKKTAKTRQAVIDYRKKLYNENGHIRPLSERKKSFSGQAFNNIEINETAWVRLSSAKMKTYISKMEIKKRRKLGNMIKTYLSLTEKIPADIRQKTFEEYNLAFYSMGRPGTPQETTNALAAALNICDQDGNPDATRLPFYAISATICHLNAKGNGLSILNQMPKLHKTLKTQTLIDTAKKWVFGKGNQYGIDELAIPDLYLTEKMINQLNLLEISGSRNLSKKYELAVRKAEGKIPHAIALNNDAAKIKATQVMQFFLQNRGK